jgi:hypothetical protein
MASISRQRSKPWSVSPTGCLPPASLGRRPACGGCDALLGP